VRRNIRIGRDAKWIVAQLRILDETGDHIDAKPRAAIEPEADHVVNRLDHFGVAEFSRVAAEENQAGTNARVIASNLHADRRKVLCQLLAAFPVNREPPDVPIAFGSPPTNATSMNHGCRSTVWFGNEIYNHADTASDAPRRQGSNARDRRLVGWITQ